MSCITLLSDFGLHDASAASARGVLMQHVPHIPIIDISHEVTPFLTAQAAYLLASTWSAFPQGTFHLVLFDIFSERVPRLVLSSHEGHFFLTPDNGVLTTALGTMPARSWLCMELTHERTFTHWLHTAGLTIAGLSVGSPFNLPPPGQPIALPAIQLTPCTLQQAPPPAPRITGNYVECHVVHIDRYGNVVTNITRPLFDQLRAGRSFRLLFMTVEEIAEISNHYQEVREGFKLARFNSSGYLEICINQGNAASLFGFQLGSRHNDIKIYFE